jgi:hypothetical protein
MVESNRLHYTIQYTTLYYTPVSLFVGYNQLQYNTIQYNTLHYSILHSY